MTLDEIRKWYESSNHITHEDAPCRTCIIGKLLGIANAAQEVVENKRFSSVGFYISELEELVCQDGWAKRHNPKTCCCVDCCAARENKK